MDKKGALELGINTIVILVIAMVVIAAGIAFIRGFFTLGEEKLKEPFNLAEFGLQPTSTEPLVMQSGDVTIKRGGEKEIKVGFYNTDNVDKTAVTIVMGDCVGRKSDGTQDTVKPTITAVSNDVKSGETAGFRVLMRAKKDGTNDNIDAGTYICKLSAQTGGVTLSAVQFTMTVTS